MSAFCVARRTRGIDLGSTRRAPMLLAGTVHSDDPRLKDCILGPPGQFFLGRLAWSFAYDSILWSESASIVLKDTLSPIRLAIT